jgi:hypothetical protein
LLWLVGVCWCFLIVLCCLSMPPNCVLLVLINVSWLCFIVAH